jgi:hypothetical protein
MEPTVTTDRNLARPASVVPILINALLGAFVVGIYMQDHWGVWDSTGRAIGVVLLIGLIGIPLRELWRERTGKDVRWEYLASTGYTLVFVATVLFNRHSR